MKPSIGRIVIYNNPGSADGKYPPTQSPAIIQHVFENGSVRLFIFGPVWIDRIRATQIHGEATIVVHVSIFAAAHCPQIMRYIVTTQTHIDTVTLVEQGYVGRVFRGGWQQGCFARTNLEA